MVNITPPPKSFRLVVRTLVLCNVNVSTGKVILYIVYFPDIYGKYLKGSTSKGLQILETRHKVRLSDNKLLCIVYLLSFAWSGTQVLG